MFSIQIEQDGLIRSVPVLSILGGDNRRDRFSEPMSIREDELPALSERSSQLWPEFDVAPLIARAVNEAQDSDLFTGTSPEQWSPLGPARAASLGRLVGEDALVDFVEQESVGDSPTGGPRARFGARFYDGLSTVTMTVDEADVGAAVFSDDAFLVALAPGSSSLYFRYEPDDGAQAEQLATAQRALREWLPEGALSTILVWRAYLGSNTTVIDGMVKLPRRTARRILLGGSNVAGVVVGRVAFAIHKRQDRPHRDPTARRRRIALESRTPDVAAGCPSVDQLSTGPADSMVIAVHGTMACALPMATALRNVVPASVPVYRYEHDTWLGITENAEELAAHIQRLAPERLLLVAHSRGGLVARQAADIVGSQVGTQIQILTLGAPFFGTPIVGGVRGGLLGVNALLGALRAVPGGHVVDAGTRLAGLLIKQEMPIGIRAMDPHGDYLSVYKHLPLSITMAFAGATDPSLTGERYGLAFLSGFAATAFAGGANDLIVGTESATGGLAAAQTVDCDHFSYLQQQPVLDKVRELAKRPRNLIKRPAHKLRIAPGPK
jgi:hypothetical protein